jgi:hypothetical protein
MSRYGYWRQINPIRFPGFVLQVHAKINHQTKQFTYADARPKNPRTYADAPGGGGGI